MEKSKSIHSYAGIGKKPTGKRPFVRSRMRWKDVAKKDVVRLGKGSNWKAWVFDSTLEVRVYDDMVLMANYHKKKKNKKKHYKDTIKLSTSPENIMKHWLSWFQ